MVSIKKLGLAGSCTFSIGLISYSLGFPTVLKSQVKSVSEYLETTKLSLEVSKILWIFQEYITQITANPLEARHGNARLLGEASATVELYYLRFQRDEFRRNQIGSKTDCTRTWTVSLRVSDLYFLESTSK